MTASCVPSTWKSGIVIPICKKGSTSDASNYMPITLTCISYKIMETIIKNDLISHSYNNKLISKLQHGFLSKHSTSTQLLECINDWAIQISKKIKFISPTLILPKNLTVSYLKNYCLNLKRMVLMVCC